MEMNQRNMKKWEQIRSKGRSRYIWVNGVVIFGLVTAISWSIMMELVQPSEFIFLRPLMALILFPAGGYFFGIFNWKANENKYVKAMKKRQGE